MYATAFAETVLKLQDGCHSYRNKMWGEILFCIFFFVLVQTGSARNIRLWFSQSQYKSQKIRAFTKYVPPDGATAGNNFLSSAAGVATSSSTNVENAVAGANFVRSNTSIPEKVPKK